MAFKINTVYTDAKLDMTTPLKKNEYGRMKKGNRFTGTGLTWVCVRDSIITPSGDVVVFPMVEGKDREQAPFYPTDFHGYVPKDETTALQVGRQRTEGETILEVSGTKGTMGDFLEAYGQRNINSNTKVVFKDA